VPITVSPAGSNLPAPWQSLDVGSTGVAGTASGTGAAFTIAGAGSDIWLTADGFQFVYQPLAGDGQIIARVATQQNTNSWAKAGVMIRDDLTAGARYAALFVTPANGLAFQRRTQAGGDSASAGVSGVTPAWLRLVRAGGLLSVYRSSDGTGWTLIGSDTVALGANVYIGLAVTSHDSGQLSSVSFDGVTTALAPPPPPPTNIPPTVSITAPAANASYTAPATVTLKATAADSDGSVASVKFYRGGTTLIGTGTLTGGEYLFTWTNVAAGSYTLTAVATDNGAATTTATAVPITISPAGSNLPAPWQSLDVGNTGVAGTASGTGAAFTIAGAGSDIWNGADALQYVYQPLAGDGQIIARVATQQNTDSWAKAGVMIRDDLSAGARYAALLVTPANGLAFQRRTQAGGGSVYTPAAGAAPSWIRLTRAGATLSAYRSTDGGATWTLVGTDTIALGSNVYIGIAVTSHNSAQLSSVTVDGVSVP
jgi:hypothetical protein